MTTEIETFDLIHANYLAARARAVDATLTEAENLEASDEDDRLLWRLIRTPAPCKSRVDIKVALVAEMIEVGQWVDNRELLMLVSIRADLARL